MACICVPACLVFALTLAAGPALAHTAQPRPRRRLVHAGLGNFPVACSPAAQQAFNRGMLLQHSFWYEAASEAFRGARPIPVSLFVNL